MKRLWWWRGLTATWVAVFLLGMAPPSAAAPPPEISAKAAVLMDAQTGKILYAKNSEMPLPMASVTKLMTLYLVVRAVERGRIRLTDMVPVTEDAYRINGSQIWLEPGERLTVQQMIKAVAIGSANDAAYALGEFMAGSEAAFVQDMNQAAAKLGMRHTHFQNPHGLHMPQHYSTAGDLAILARKAVTMPLLLKYTAMWQDRTIRNGKGGTLWLINHNRLLRQFPGTDGLKTGYTSQAGFCIVATALRAGTRMIAVVLGADSSKSRFDQSASLMSWGFTHFKTVYLAKTGQHFGTVQVRRGDRPAVAAATVRTVAVTVERGSRASLRVVPDLVTSVPAPVHAGQVLGQLQIYQGSQRIDQVPLVAAAAVLPVHVPELVWRFFWKMVG